MDDKIINFIDPRTIGLSINDYLQCGQETNTFALTNSPTTFIDKIYCYLHAKTIVPKGNYTQKAMKGRGGGGKKRGFPEKNPIHKW